MQMLEGCTEDFIVRHSFVGVVDLCVLSWCQGSAIAMLLLHCRQGSAWKLMLLWLPAGNGENTAGFF